MREIRLDADARPHSVTPGPDGNLWYMGNGNGTIGKVNAETWEVEQIVRMNDPNATDPHTVEFNYEGILFFTLQGSNMIGRFNPETSDLRLITLPTPNGRPYGIKIDSAGMVWVAYNGSNRIGRVHPETMEVTEFPTPWPETRIRRLALTSDDTVYYLDNGRGTLGRLDAGTGDITEWPSPSGPDSHPYAMEIIDDVIWYHASNQRPDSLVRFDPATETFQSWAIPSGYGIVRHMRATADGNLLIHQSMSNRIGLVTIPDAAGN
jgi:virginiamycin B lyase